MRRTMRLRDVRVSSHLVLQLLTKGESFNAFTCIDGLPQDAKIVGVQWDGRVLTLRTTSKEYAPVAESDEVPVTHAIYETTRAFTQSAVA